MGDLDKSMTIKLRYGFIIIVSLLSLGLVQSATIDSEAYLITDDIWYNFYSDYNLTGLLALNSTTLNIEDSYIFEITTEESICNVTLMNLSSTYMKFNLTCNSSVDWVYLRIGNFSGNREVPYPQINPIYT